jgi:23S rRNA (guanosine2251-2'-O)-methyltransferase
MEKTDLVYGTRAVMEAIRAGKEVERILVQKGLHNDLIKELTKLAREYNIPISPVPAERMKRLTTRNHQGVICYLSAVQYASLDNTISECFAQAKDPFVLMLDRITDVRNFGAIVRTAECMGVHCIIIPEKGNAPLTSDAVKTSAGALHHMPVCREKDLRQTCKLLRDSGMKIVACTEKGAQDISATNLTGPVVLIMGSEEDGITPALLREADELVRIPMHGEINSLNVSVAAGMALYEINRQRTL